MGDYDVRGVLDPATLGFPGASLARAARERAILTVAVALAVLAGTGLSLWAERQTHLRTPAPAARSCIGAHSSGSHARGRPEGCRP
jgi:hypothetical protein